MGKETVGNEHLRERKNEDGRWSANITLQKFKWNMKYKNERE